MQVLEGLEWLDDRFHLIRCQNDELPSIEWVLDLARAAVLRWPPPPPPTHTRSSPACGTITACRNALAHLPCFTRYRVCRVTLQPAAGILASCASKGAACSADNRSNQVRRFGIRGLVIDPYNELDHQRPSFMSETEYVSQMLTKIKRFAQHHDVHVWFVAHPRQVGHAHALLPPEATLIQVFARASMMVHTCPRNRAAIVQ